MAQAAKGGLPFSITPGQQVTGETLVSKVVHIPAAANDTFILQDGTGKLFLQGKASGTGAQPYDYPTPVQVKDLGCAQLSAGGTLLVYPA